MDITINGKKAPLWLSYEEIVSRAGHNPQHVLTVVYHVKTGPDSSRDGSLCPGQNVEVADGMIFNVANTGSA